MAVDYVRDAIDTGKRSLRREGLLPMADQCCKRIVHTLARKKRERGRARFIIQSMVIFRRVATWMEAYHKMS
ncbi:MAG: hypothetical protein LZF61_07140 [Nitrosomonas sp.]|nr:MAG: hypothetical protein LZF61_07140 [Nitrosomonas sp.]